jgi:hypothetical protein
VAEEHEAKDVSAGMRLADQEKVRVGDWSNSSLLFIDLMWIDPHLMMT